MWRLIMYFKFLLNMWKLRRLTIEEVDEAVTKGLITQEQGDAIKETIR